MQTNENLKRDFAESEENSEARFRSQRLRQIVEDAGGNSVVASLADIGTTTISGYLNGREWKLGIIEKIVRACGADLQWLLFGNKTSSSENMLTNLDNIKDEDRISIRLYNVEASAGRGMTVSNIENYAYIDLIKGTLPPYVLSRIKNLVGVTVRGDSMQTTLYDGDIIFIDKEDTDVIPGCVYVLRRDHDLMVKRLTWTMMGDLIVSSDNPRYHPETINAERARALFEAGSSPVQVIGRVIWKMGSIGSV